MSRSFRFKSSLVVGTVLVLAAVMPGAPVGAATPKTFKHVYTCNFAEGSDVGDTVVAGIFAYVNLGYFTGTEGSDHPGDPCYGGDTFHPSVQTVAVRFRWYAGTKLIRSSTGKNGDVKPSRTDKLDRKLRGDGCAWYSLNRRISLKITLAKNGYVTKRITTKCFYIPS